MTDRAQERDRAFLLSVRNVMEDLRSGPSGREVPRQNHGRLEDPDERGGWTKRFMARGSRLDEWTALYESLGFEVRVEAGAPADLPEECRSGRELEGGECWTIYTRPKQ
jgi:hypothetical protein